MSNEQLQNLIEQEAKDYARDRHDQLANKKHLHRKTLLMYAHQDGAKNYAAKWQEAQQRAEIYKTLLKEWLTLDSQHRWRLLPVNRLLK